MAGCRHPQYFGTMKPLPWIAALCLTCTLPAGAAETSLMTLANPLAGTDSTVGFSHGNEFPAIALPFPMNAWAPYTQPQHDSFYYSTRRKKSVASARRTSPALGWATMRRSP